MLTFLKRTRILPIFWMFAAVVTMTGFQNCGSSMQTIYRDPASLSATPDSEAAESAAGRFRSIAPSRRSTFGSTSDAGRV